jgi:hypothetical protein
MEASFHEFYTSELEALVKKTAVAGCRTRSRSTKLHSYVRTASNRTQVIRRKAYTLKHDPRGVLFMASFTVNEKISHISYFRAVYCISTSLHEGRHGPNLRGEGRSTLHQLDEVRRTRCVLCIIFVSAFPSSRFLFT